MLHPVVDLLWQLVRPHSQGEVEACRLLAFRCELQICEISTSGLFLSPVFFVISA